MNLMSALPTDPVRSHLGVVDLFKALAAQLIVLHHLALYGPMSDRAWPIAPGLLGWLADEARIAVQVFLVVGGFLAARALAPHGLPDMANPAGAVLRRFAKLVLPYLAAMLLAVAASAAARAWMTHDSIPAAPTPGQLAAHALLLQDVLGAEALSAGIWYIAIDFQLYALLAALLWLAARVIPQRHRSLGVILAVAAAMTASLLHFNRDPRWDAWAVYFAGSYGLGVLAWWASDGRRSRAAFFLLLAAMTIPALIALAVDFRVRIAVALFVALMLVALVRSNRMSMVSRLPAIAFLGRISYALFLVHFPVCLLVNAAFTRFAPADPWVQAGGMLAAWLASIAAAAAFHRHVEIPLGRGAFPWSRRNARAERLAP